ncbi:hypothetical protein [Arthrobacter sp. HLT1-21]
MKTNDRTIDPDLDLGAITSLLASRGRSSTPPPPNQGDLKLKDMLAIDYHCHNTFHPKLRVAAIVHDLFLDELQTYYLVLPLFPSTLVESIDAGQPNLIIIHRSAFADGPWFGSETSAGGTMIDELRRILPWSRKKNVPVVFVENGQEEQTYTQSIRNIGTVIFPSEEFFDVLPESPRRRKIYELAQQFGRHKQEYDGE